MGAEDDFALWNLSLACVSLRYGALGLPYTNQGKALISGLEGPDLFNSSGFRSL